MKPGSHIRVLKVEADTDKAHLIVFTNGFTKWMPKSQIKISEFKGSTYIFGPAWLIDKTKIEEKEFRDDNN